MTEEIVQTAFPQRPGSHHLFVFKEQVHPEGGKPRTVAFTDIDVRPLSYEELLEAKLRQGVSIPLEMYDARIVETDAEGIDTSEDVHAHITAKLVSSSNAQAIGLVPGGWLPSYLAATKRNAVILPDRNIISKITGHFKNSRRTERKPDFLDMFENVPIKINPMLSVMESNSRMLPDPASVWRQFEEVTDKLKKALPSADIMVGSASYGALLGLIESSRSEWESKQAFLIRLAPMLSSPVARRKIDQQWQAVFNAADDCKVPRASLVVLAALSVLVNPSGYCAAKKVLKFRSQYNMRDAHNALCDFRALNMLVNCHAFFPEFYTQLCTEDRNLALFWVGADISEIEHDGDDVYFTARPHDALLSADYAERWADAIRSA